jgi:hypothetical protein
LDNGDRNCRDDNHVNVAALTQNKLQENPEHHQNCKSDPHFDYLINELTILRLSGWLRMRPARKSNSGSFLD